MGRNPKEERRRAVARVPLPKPETDCYHLVRFIRSDRRLDIFGERFLLPPEAEYESTWSPPSTWSVNASA